MERGLPPAGPPQAGLPNPVNARAGAGTDVIQPEAAPQDAAIAGVDVGHAGHSPSVAAEPHRIPGESLGPAAGGTVAAGVWEAGSALAAAGHVMRIATADLTPVAVKVCG